jgi:hypothetical protein
MPASSATLSASATDPERDTISYVWSVTHQPAGAGAILSKPNAASTQAANLTVPVYPVNNPPVVSSAAASPAELTLPMSSSTLSAVASDPDGDVIFCGWSLNDAPTGATAIFSNQGSATTTVSGLDVAGTYTAGSPRRPRRCRRLRGQQKLLPDLPGPRIRGHGPGREGIVARKGVRHD